MCVWAATAAEPAPSPEEAARLREGAREIAVNYARTLPDFECTETVRREIARLHGPRRLFDVLTIKVSFVDRRDRHELLLVDGRKTDQAYNSLAGAVGEGEFGATLATIFDRVAGAEFEWRSWTTAHGRRAAVYNYRVEGSKAHYAMVYQTEATGPLHAMVGFHGEVVIDRETFGVLRLTYEIEGVPKDFPVRASLTTVEYGFTEIGGRRFLLPIRARTDMQTAAVATFNQAEFRGYRKFEADSKVVFSDEKP